MGSQPKPTQDFVPVKEIRGGTAILKDGSMRAILLASSLNFALKSEDEQAALISQFQNFFNSLEFSLQIFIQSRRLDIRPYIALLEERYKEQLGELLKIQTREYIEFIKNFTESSEIMTKNFFVVVPYAPALIKINSSGLPLPLDIFRKKQQGTPVQKELESFEEHQTQLEHRVSVVEQGLIRMGIRTVRLGTEEIIELFYKIFNPGELEKPIPLQ
jgi:hypothetical protein